MKSWGDIMKFYAVTHKTFGDGVVVKIRNGDAYVKFGTTEKKFAIKGFDKFFVINDMELQKIVESANADNTVTRDNSVQTTQRITFGNEATTYSIARTSNALLGPRSQTIPVQNEHQMFELVGYMAKPGRISSIEAEVPVDGRDEVFEELFPGQKYRPIALGETPSGMPNKLSPQFRINFANLRNCPSVLKNNMGAGNAACVGRINKSKFVITLVQGYGFRFGDWQNTDEIRKIAESRGYLEDFERGYSL